jgi:phosphoenolpyruvate carboxylase
MILSPILVLDPRKVARDLAFVMDCLAEVLAEAQQAGLAQALPWRCAEAPHGDEPVSVDRLSRAYSIAFHLLSLVEQNAAIQQQGATEAAHGPSALQALWGQSLEQLRDRGLTSAQIAATLRRVQVELVLTAHPTEAKRTIVLEHHRSLYLLLVKRENQVWTPNEQRAIREEFKTLLSLLGLHDRQIALLREWRRAGRAGDAEAASALLAGLLLTINAIAGGLGGTG